MTPPSVRWVAMAACALASCGTSARTSGAAPVSENGRTAVPGVKTRIQQLETRADAIPPSTVSIELVKIPAGTWISHDSSQRQGTVEVPVRSLWFSRTEVSWDAYDLFVYGLADPDPQNRPAIDGVTYPTKPYVAMDRSYGHSGFPAISVSFHGAETFCKWLSAKTGKHYRLPTETEWRYACAAGGAGEIPDGDTLSKRAWLKESAGGTTHPMAGKEPNEFGLFDMIGNACEWAAGADGKPCALGGAFFHPAADLARNFRLTPVPAWNASDPQIPKSIWWLADAGFTGFRVVCED